MILGIGSKCAIPGTVINDSMLYWNFSVFEVTGKTDFVVQVAKYHKFISSINYTCLKC